MTTLKKHILSNQSFLLCLVTFFSITLLSCNTSTISSQPSPMPSNIAKKITRPVKWISLFDGKTMGNWKSTEFGGEGEAEVEDGLLYVSNGVGLSGITWQKDNIPTNNIEYSVDFKKTDGSDFGLALTFPVKKSFASYICGGWGGSTIGISSIDHFDASNNETTNLHKFVIGQWYNLRVRITTDKIEAWIDNEKVTNYIIKGHLITTRPEVNLAKPLGLSNFQTGSAFKNIKYRIVTKPHTPAVNEDEDY